MKKLFLIIGILLINLTIAAQNIATLDVSGVIPASIQVSLDGAVAGGSHLYTIPAIAVDGTFALSDTTYDLFYMSNVPSCTVSVVSTNQDASDFRLTDGSSFIPYSLMIGSYDCNPVTNAPIAAAVAAYVWTAPASGSTISIGNAIAVAGLPAGTYSDTLTFTITAP